ncbi:hypothetical protein K9M74_01095 [Candidatus Woesearchaeota archaeon]|nr:hypothetical protein [Candidatus Woesearchaeota archaeon]
MGHASNLHVEMMEEEAKLKNPCPKCPEGDGYLVPSDDISRMSEGQYMDWLAGHGHQFTCDNCGYEEEREVDMFKDIPEEEDLFKFDDQINEHVIEDLIERAIEKRCFIEALSLIHNVIELYLKYRIKLHIFKKEGLDGFGIDLSKHKKDEQGREIVEHFGDETDNEKRAKIKFKMLFTKNNYLHNYKELCFILNLIDKEMVNLITDFNKRRNLAIHNLLREDKSKGNHMKYSEIILTAKLGRRIQLKLSPINHSDQDISNILKKFDISDDEVQKDQFLKK